MALSDLMSIWRGRDLDTWSRAPGRYQSFAESLLRRGEPLLAYDVVNEALAKWPDDPRLRQLQGLALARSGATERANAVLERLRQSGLSDEETLGMLARTYKDLASSAVCEAERREYLGCAAEIYLQAYESSGGYWSGINAATMSLLIGQTEQATELARQVHGQCHQLLSQSGEDEYWLLAALGEAALVLRDWEEAEKWYQRAAKLGARRFGDLHSSRRNARLILQQWNRDRAAIDKCLAIPPVIVFSGHMIDAPKRTRSRFPVTLEGEVAKALRERIRRLKPGFGFASAACGSDILFLEAMLDAGAEISIVLPYNKDEFTRDSVDFLPGSSWHVRFERVMERAARCITASVHKFEVGSVSYDFGNELLFGLANIHARRLETPLLPLAVWDRSAGDGPGGTASAVKNWRIRGYTPEIIDLSQIPRDSVKHDHQRSRQEISAPAGLEERGAFTSRVVAILFADAVGFSKLHERQVPLFIEHFLGAIAQLSGKYRKHIVAKNTWGDGLYFILSDVDHAGKFGLALADLICTTNWQEKGLPPGLNLRIGLHAGPVYEFDDPVTGVHSFSGTHVSRAARIEPITPPGHVYASEAFAALAAARGADGFVCDYVGQTPLAKEYGTLPMYHVRWDRGSAPHTRTN